MEAGLVSNEVLAYLALLQRWNRVYNLTAVRDPDEMVTHHLLDRLAVIAPLQKQLAVLAAQGVVGDKPRLLDVGSGAGLPGIVIAICCPHITVHCVDTVAKKAAFIQQVAVTLKLPVSRTNTSCEPLLKSEVRNTSRRPPGTLPGCGSVGPPVWSCQKPWSFCVTRPISP